VKWRGDYFTPTEIGERTHIDDQFHRKQRHVKPCMALAEARARRGNGKTRSGQGTASHDKASAMAMQGSAVLRQGQGKATRQAAARQGNATASQHNQDVAM
jgi:hypothetical protein